MKKITLALAGLLGFGWRLIPARIRIGLFTSFLILDSRDNAPREGLARLLCLKDKVDWVINERAMNYGNGEHPKHRLTQYHQFFINRITNGHRVLDVGCGYGSVSRSIAIAHPSSEVVGVDRNHKVLELALTYSNPPNLRFLKGDATQMLPTGTWDTVVLSNVLEHIDNRVAFLKNLQKSTGANQYLIRVPLFERDWQMALRRELGISFFSDCDHKIEHTRDEFLAELDLSGLTATELITVWGEIWATCSPLKLDTNQA